MTRNTATGAKQERKITFKNKEHEKFYNTYLSKCPCQDSYHKSIWSGINPGGENATKTRKRRNIAYLVWKHCQRKG